MNNDILTSIFKKLSHTGDRNIRYFITKEDKGSEYKSEIIFKLWPAYRTDSESPDNFKFEGEEYTIEAFFEAEPNCPISRKKFDIDPDGRLTCCDKVVEKVEEFNNLTLDTILHDEIVEKLSKRAEKGFQFIINNSVYRLSYDNKKFIKNGSNKSLNLENLHIETRIGYGTPKLEIYDEDTSEFYEIIPVDVSSKEYQNI